MDSGYALLRRFVPAPIRSLRWRCAWLIETSAYSEKPFSSVRKLLHWTLRELCSREIHFTTPDGTRYVSMPNNLSSLIVYIQNDRDPAIQAFIRRRLHAGDTFVDVGANVGVYTIPAARLLGQRGRVIAIEAHPVTFEFLCRNIAVNGLSNVTSVNRAVGDRPGILSMIYCEGNPGQTHVAAENDSAAVELPVQTLDVILVEQGISRVDYLKIDVEGFEWPVLNGARAIIAGSPNIVVQVEQLDEHASRYGYSIEAVATLLFEHGLTPHRASPAGDVFAITHGDLAAGGDILWLRGDRHEV